MSLPQMIGGLLVGALASSLLGKNNSTQQATSSAIQYQPTQAMPTVPKAPEAVAEGEDNAAAQAVKEAEEKEKQLALARQKGGQDVFTSPLGVMGQANVNRKQMLGA